MSQELVDALSNIKFIEMKASFGMAYELVNDFLRAEDEALPVAAKEKLLKFKV